MLTSPYLLLAALVLLLLTNWLLFRGKPAALDSESAQADLASLVPGARPGDIAVSADGKACLIENVADNSIYLLLAGDKNVLRRLSRRLVRRASCNGGELLVRFTDFGLPPAHLRLVDDRKALAWQARIDSLE
jgi:hypothetical protein